MSSSPDDRSPAPPADSLEALQERIHNLRQDGFHRSASRLARELKRRAKAEQQVVPYLLGNFYLMNNAQPLLETETGVEAAIEAIALLESEEKARQIQPHLPEAEYYYTVGWMSSCAYDNLGTHVGEQEGYNSEGIHDCINDGISVCRKTGKLECITCFREYAADVYRAADDLPMALHHARYVATHHNPDTQNDRRWVGSEALAQLLLLMGDLEAAREAATNALSLVDSYHDRVGARQRTQVLLHSILLLQNRADDLPGLLSDAGIDPQSSRMSSAGENPALEILCAQADAIEAINRGDYDSPLRSLAQWDRWLSNQRALNHWFDIRLRLIATYLLAGRVDRVAGLIKPLEEKATQARDWLTLRRLTLLREGTFPPSPIAACGPMSSGPFSLRSTTPTEMIDSEGLSFETAGSDAASDDIAATLTFDSPAAGAANVPAPIPTAGEPLAAASAAAESPASEPPMAEITRKIETFADRLRDSGGKEDVFRDVGAEVLKIAPAELTNPRDVAWLIHLAHITSKVAGTEFETWSWATSVAERFMLEATVLNVLADLGHSLHECNAEEAEKQVSMEQVDSWFRASLDLDPYQPNNYSRAAAHYLALGRTSEAERCFARAFRLDRTNGQVALRLSDLYSESDRPRDALAVLDMCIREGCHDSPIFWQAGLLALSVDEYESAISYFTRFEDLEPGQPWTSYYRALALLEAQRPGPALAAIDLEATRSPEHELPLSILRAWAASLLERSDMCIAQLDKVLACPLSSVDYLTESGLARLFARLYRAALSLPDDLPQRRTLIRLLLQTGLAPEELFHADRLRHDRQQGLNFYVCVLRQPLPEDWASFPGCMAGQLAWTAYEAAWGILAESEDEAESTALAWQSRCCPLPATVTEVQLQGEGFEDCPGVLWQGIHQPVDGSSSAENEPPPDENA